MATLASYTTLVQNEVDDNSVTRKTIIEQALQDTYQEIVGFVLPYLVASTEEDITATASQRYVTPTNTYQIIEHVLWKNTGTSNYIELSPSSKKTYYAQFVNRDATTNPTGYYMEANNVYFDLTPDNAGTVRVNGYTVQDELSGDTTSVIPDRYERVLMLGAISRFKAFEGLTDEAHDYQKAYQGPYYEQGKIGGALKHMIDELATKQKRLRPLLYGK